MASSSSTLTWLLAAAAMAAAFLPVPAVAEIFLVGDTTGWNLSYPIGWPEGKTFKVGDSLVFDYPKGQFTVTEVDSETFRECYLQGNTIHEWTSGHDVVPLENPGRRWFFSSLANHCDLGLKLFVSVAGGSASGAPAPAPEHHQPPNPAPSPVNVRPMSPAPTPVSPAPTPEAPPSPDKSSAGLNCYKIGEAVARAAVVAGAVVAAVFV